MSALDDLIDRIEAGQDVIISLYEVEVRCRFPLLAGSTSWNRGCRCDRCYKAKTRRTRRHILPSGWAP